MIKVDVVSLLPPIVISRVLLDWIAGLVNLDCNPFCWIGLWLTIQFQNWILIWIGNPAKPLQSKSKEISSFYFLSRKLLSSYISKPSQFLLTVLKKFGSCLGLRNGPWGLKEKSNCKQKYIFCWIVIGFGLDCQSILKSGCGFGLSIINLQRIWIGLTIRKNWIEQYPGDQVAKIYKNYILLGKISYHVIEISWSF